MGCLTLDRSKIRAGSFSGCYGRLDGRLATWRFRTDLTKYLRSASVRLRECTSDLMHSLRAVLASNVVLADSETPWPVAGVLPGRFDRLPFAQQAGHETI